LGGTVLVTLTVFYILFSYKLFALYNFVVFNSDIYRFLCPSDYLAEQFWSW